MTQKFTEKAEEALNGAITVAEEVGECYVGTEHLLLSLLKTGPSAATVLLERAGADLKTVQACVQDEKRAKRSALDVRDMTPRLREVLDGAVTAQKKFGAHRIGTEHILYSLVADPDTAATRMLSVAGLDTAALQESVSSFLVAGAAVTDPPVRKDLNPVLLKYGQEMTSAEFLEGRDPVIGRDAETERLVRILCRKNKNNPCLVGDAGVGKTAIVEGLAQRIGRGEVPSALLKMRIVSLDLSAVIAGTKYRGDFEERIKNVLNAVKDDPTVTLFIDEIHSVVGAGAAEGAIDAANILKPALSRGSVRVIGATTPEEYRVSIEKDPALARRFQSVEVCEPSAEEAVRILFGLKARYEAHHGIKIDDGAIKLAVKLSARYMPDKRLPDKALDLIDEACSKATLVLQKSDEKSNNIDNITEQKQREKERAVKRGAFDTAFAIQKEMLSLDEKYAKKKHEIKKSEESLGTCVTEENIRQVTAEITGIPPEHLGAAATKSSLFDALSCRVVGQEGATRAVCAAIERSLAGLSDPTRPMGTFLFIGESGVGKTELAKALAKALFDDEGAMIRYDMSEFAEPHSVSKLIGSPPGYVGYEAGGNLCERIRRAPYSVLLFDEIEKAHGDVLALLLQITDEGMLTENDGRHAYFKNAIVIMTSNVCAPTDEMHKTGFLESKDVPSDDALLRRLSARFRPELLNRIDRIVLFEPLGHEELCKIAKNRLSELAIRAKSRGVTLEFGDDAVSLIATLGEKHGYGARPLSRVICDEVEAPLSTFILEKRGTVARLSVKDGKPCFIFHAP